MRNRAPLMLLISASFFALTCRDVGASGIFNNAFLAVTEFNNQEGTNSPRPDPVRPYRALSQIGLTGDQPTDGYLVSPASPPRRWRFARIDGNGLWVGVDFKNFSSLTNAFPSGSYRLEVATKSGSPLVTNVHLAPIAFPKAPHILSGDKTAWVGSRLYLTAPSEGATIEWAPAGAGVNEIFVVINGTEFTVSPSATNYHIPPAVLRELPTEELVGVLVQFNTLDVSTATTFWLWKPQLWQRSFFAVARGRTFVQTSNATPAPWTPPDAALFDSEFGPFNFAMTGSRPGVVKGPGGRSYPLSFSSPETSIYQSGPYSSQRAVDANHPNGKYTFGTQSAYLVTTLYPNNGAPIKLLSVNGKPPRWRQGKLLLEEKINNTLVWSAFQPVKGMPFATRGLITFSTGYVTEHSTRATDVVEAGLLTGRTTPFNRYRIPKGALQPGRDHYISIQYLLASFADPKNMSAAGASTTTYISVLPLP